MARGAQACRFHSRALPGSCLSRDFISGVYGWLLGYGPPRNVDTLGRAPLSRGRGVRLHGCEHRSTCDRFLSPMAAADSWPIGHGDHAGPRSDAARNGRERGGDRLPIPVGRGGARTRGGLGRTARRPRNQTGRARPGRRNQTGRAGERRSTCCSFPPPCSLWLPTANPCF